MQDEWKIPADRSPWHTSRVLSTRNPSQGLRNARGTGTVDSRAEHSPAQQQKDTMKLTLTSGLPASGKSTWAKAVEAKNQMVKRVNRDDIRTELFGEDYHTGSFPKKAEDKVTTVEIARVARYLAHGYHVISDNTYLFPGAIQRMMDVAQEMGVPVSIQRFNVDAAECKRRNIARGAEGGRQVPEHIMDHMIQHAYTSDGNLRQFTITDYQVEVDD